MIYQYTATVNTDINYNINIGASNNSAVKDIKPKAELQRFQPALQRASKALQLVNPFKGV